MEGEKKYLKVSQSELKSDESEKVLVEKSSLKGDYGNIGLLLLLYLLQGIPQGIAAAIPILLQKRGVSYTDQASYSIAYFPSSMKLLWAPIVDSIYIKSFGRRKSWICSSQILIGVFMIYLSYNVDNWLGDEGDESSKPQIFILTCVFFILWFLTSAQDIAVDGWGLTLLQRRNVGYAATCNSVGQSAGKFIGFIILLVFESKDFCNDYIYNEPRDMGLFTLSGFFLFWAVAFLTITILIGIFKFESPDNVEELERHPDHGFRKAYPIFVRMLKIKPIMQFYMMLFTIEGCFTALSAVTPLKLIEYGISKDKFALLSIPSAPVQILLPLFITKYTTSGKPLSYYYKVFPYRLVFMITTAVVVYSKRLTLDNESLLIYFYTGIVLLFMAEQGFIRVMYTCDQAFSATMADPMVGGAFITLVNSFGNFGKKLFETFFLWLVDKITWKSCKNYENAENLIKLININNTCGSIEESAECKDSGGFCETIIDGYYIEIAISAVYAIIWFKLFKNVIYKLQKYPREDWFVFSRNSAIQNVSEKLDPI